MRVQVGDPECVRNTTAYRYYPAHSLGAFAERRGLGQVGLRYRGLFFFGAEKVLCFILFSEGGVTV